MDTKQFVAELAKLRSCSTFLTLKKYHSSSGEIADYNIIFHMSYENALLRSIAALQSIVPSSDLEAQAKDECLHSFMESLDKVQTSSFEEDDGYRRFFDDDGKHIKGIKLHEETNTLHLFGLVVNKKVLVPGNYKKCNSKPLTIAKNKLRKLCPVSKFRQFQINSDQLESISVEGLHLLPPDSE